MLNLFKKVKYPSGEMKEADAFHSWTVSWMSWHYHFSNYATSKQEHEVFTQEAQAKEFVKALNEASNFLRNRGVLFVSIKANQ